MRMARGSPNTVEASSKATPCFRRFNSALAGSHSKTYPTPPSRAFHRSLLSTRDDCQVFHFLNTWLADVVHLFHFCVNIESRFSSLKSTHMFSRQDAKPAKKSPTFTCSALFEIRHSAFDIRFLPVGARPPAYHNIEYRMMNTDFPRRKKRQGGER